MTCDLKRNSRKKKMKNKKERKKRKTTIATCPVFNFQEEEKEKGANNVKFSENEGKKEKSPIGHTTQNLILLKRRLLN